MRLGVSSYSFDQYIQQGKMTQFDTIAKAKELGFDFIEMITLTPHDGSTKLEYAKKLRKEAERANIEIKCYSVDGDLAQNTEEKLSEAVEVVKAELDIAKELGCSFFRHDALETLNSFRSFDLALPMVAKGTRMITEYGEKLGIRTTCENHGYICQDSDRMERLFNAVNHENFGLLVDFGNFVYADEKPELAVSRLAGYAFHAHVKDMVIKSFYEAETSPGYWGTRGGNKFKNTVVGHGNVAVKQCMEVLKNRRYTGDLTLEFEGPEDCIYAVSEGLKNLRIYLEELGIAE